MEECKCNEYEEELEDEGDGKECRCGGEERLEQLSRLGDPLERLNEIVDWELFRDILSKVYPKRPPLKDDEPVYDAVMMFKAIVLQHLYNLTDEQMEYQVRDRMTFLRFLGLGPFDDIPDAKALWDFRTALIRADVINSLFDTLENMLNKKEEEEENKDDDNGDDGNNEDNGNGDNEGENDNKGDENKPDIDEPPPPTPPIVDVESQDTESILLSIKKLLGIAAGYKHFDADLIMHINSTLLILNQIGIGPVGGFLIRDESAAWVDFIDEYSKLEFIKSYVYLKVKLLFDPPMNSAVIESMNRMISELEWRIMIEADNLSDEKRRKFQNE